MSMNNVKDTTYFLLLFEAFLRFPDDGREKIINSI